MGFDLAFVCPLTTIVYEITGPADLYMGTLIIGLVPRRVSRKLMSITYGTDASDGTKAEGVHAVVLLVACVTLTQVALLTASTCAIHRKHAHLEIDN